MLAVVKHPRLNDLMMTLMSHSLLAGERCFFTNRVDISNSTIVLVEECTNVE
jgi:hypothetical protein